MNNTYLHAILLMSQNFLSQPQTNRT